MTPYRDRAISSLVRDALADLPVVAVTGLRQAGKTTFLQHDPSVGARRYVSLDDFAQLTAARSDPESFVESAEPLTIDEAQKFPELLTAIKRSIDKDRRPGRFLLSGSANFALLRGLSETLAGRALYVTLHPFSRREIQGRLGVPAFLRAFFASGEPPPSTNSTALHPHEILRGGLPPVCLKKVKRAELWFKGYEQTYLERDVRELARIGDLVAFRGLLRLAALRSGQVLSVSNLARDAKLNAATTTRHLSLLEASFVMTRLAPYLGNKASRLIKSPKVYIADAGLGAFLADVDETSIERGDPLWGSLLETYVAQNLVALIESDWPKARLYYWHVQGRHEVDFVIEQKRETLAIEVKAGTRWDERDLAGLRAFLASTPRCRAAILAYNGKDSVKLGDKLWAIPLGLLLS